METGAKLAYTMEAAHGWCIGEYAYSVSQVRPDANAAVVEINSGRCICAGSPAFNFAVGLALGRPITPAEFASVETFFRIRGIPPRIDVTPYSHSSLTEHLRERGYTPAEFTTVLSRNLDDSLSRIPIPEHVTFCWTQPEHCERWVDIIAKCFFVYDPGPVHRSNVAALFHVPNSLNLVALVGDEVVAAAGGMLPDRMTSDNNTPVLYGSAVLPEFRRRGIHCALVRLRLERARDAGYHVAAVSATPGSSSERNLIRCGFNPCYEKITYVAAQ